MTNRDWVEIENELNGLLLGLPQARSGRRGDHSVRQMIQKDEKALLAHIAEALVQEKHYRFPG